MIDPSSLMPLTDLLGSKQPMLLFCFVRVGFPFCSTNVSPTSLLPHVHAHRVFLLHFSVTTEMFNFCSLCHRYFYGMVFSNAKPEGLIITTSQWNASGPCLSFTENYLWSTLSLPCYLLPLLVKWMTSLLSETAVICQGMMTIKSEEQ